MSGEEASPQQSSSWVRSFCCRVLQTGKIPRHVAIIMDGNRRFAKKMHYVRSFQGHVSGFEKLLETLEWCLDLGITELTVYAFSIENFKRSKEEVDGLMELAKQKVAKLLEERELIMKHGVCIRVLGDLELLPSDVLESVARAVNFSRDNTRAFLNVCFAYTSRHEMTASIKRLAQGTEDGMIVPSDVSEELFERCLYTGDSPPPDLVIRTSGEVRLSDFLLWQSSYSCLCFQDILWPEFSIWNFFSAILSYQRNYPAIQAAREKHLQERDRLQYEADKQCVLMQFRSEHSEQTPDTSSPPSLAAESLQDLEQRTKEYAAQRRARIEAFLRHVAMKHRLFLENACPR